MDNSGLHDGPPGYASWEGTPYGSLTGTLHVHSRVLGSRAPARRLEAGAPMSVEHGCRPEADIEPRESGSARGRWSGCTGHVTRDRHLRRVRPRLGRASASVNASLKDAWPSRPCVDESPTDRAQGCARSRAARTRSSQTRCLWERLHRALRATTGTRSACTECDAEDVPVRHRREASGYAC